MRSLSAKGQSINVVIVLIAGAIAASTARAQACTSSWQVVNSTVAPAARSGCENAAVFDSIRNVTVHFGGFVQGSSPSAETWELSGSSWMLRSQSGPQARAMHAMAFDSVRGRTMLFGGIACTGCATAGNVFDDLWEWDGSSWSLIHVGGPSARYLHGMVFDPLRSRLVLFGGLDTSGYLGDTWEWDGIAWAQASTTGPGARCDFAAAFDGQSGTTTINGGSSAATSAHNDTWRWDGLMWSFVEQGSSGPRASHAMIFCSITGRLIIVGGGSSQYTFSIAPKDWDGAAWTNVPIAPSSPTPLQRAQHAMVWDSAVGSLVVLFGWSGSAILGDVWRWTPVAASQALTPLGPNAPNTLSWSPAVGGNGHAYEIVDTACSGITWANAHATALAAGGHLATPTTPAENAFIFSLLQPQHFAPNGSGPHLGGVQPTFGAEPGSDWRWTSGEPWTWSNWAPSEPNNGSNEDRLQFANAASPGLWNDISADATARAYIVEYDTSLPCTLFGGTAFSLCAAHNAAGDARLQIFNLPTDTLYGKTLISTAAATPLGSGSFFGLNADLFTLTVLLAPPQIGDPLSWWSTEPGLFPDAPYLFPPGLMLPFAGTTWDLVAVAVTTTGTIHFSNFVQNTW